MAETAWVRLERVIFRDRITGEVRVETDKVIEVVVHSGDILVQDVPSGTHRMIPVPNLILATLEGKV